MKRLKKICLVVIVAVVLLVMGALNQVQLFGWNGSSWVRMAADDATNALTSILYPHHEIHEGSSYTVNYQGAVTNTNEQTVIAFNTPNSVSWVHMVVVATSDDSASFIIAEVTSIDDGEGTEKTIYNCNRNSDNTSGCLSIEAVASAGEVSTYDETAAANANITTTITIYHEDIGETGNPQTSSGGGTRGISEFVLKQNTEYAFILNAENANDQVHNIILNWYEHTNE